MCLRFVPCSCCLCYTLACDTEPPPKTRRALRGCVCGNLGTTQPVAGSLSRPSRWSKRRKKRFAVDGEEGPQGLIVRQDELEDAPDDQLPPRVGERRGS